MAATLVAEELVQVLRLPPLPTIQEILRLYKLRALKHLSQNFLLEEKYTNKIVNAAGNIRGTYVCEVGPGPGSITRSILKKGAKKLVVVEKDTRFQPCLELLTDVCGDRLNVIYGDILQTKMDSLFPKEVSHDWTDTPPPIHVIGNLPFNVSTPLIIRWLRAMSERSGVFSHGRVPLTLTFQKEVAERMVADILSPQRCRLSIMCQYLAKVEHKFTIEGKVFLPKPDVDVGVVHFRPLKEPLIRQPFPLVEKMMRHVFHFRQKYCKRGVETLFPPHVPELTKEIFTVADVDPTTRPYELDIEELQRMCDVYSNICRRIPGIQDYEYRLPKSVEEWKDKLL